MREFESGATRDDDVDKLDYEGFISPLVLLRYAAYMHKNRLQSDGNTRHSDNWQMGMPQSVYMKAMIRHVVTAWTLHRDKNVANRVSEVMKEALCAILFNTMGMLHQMLETERSDDE